MRTIGDVIEGLVFDRHRGKVMVGAERYLCYLQQAPNVITTGVNKAVSTFLHCAALRDAVCYWVGLSLLVG